MQIITGNLKISNGVGNWVEPDNLASSTPLITIGIMATLRIALKTSYIPGTETGALPAYPANEINGLSLMFVMDLDYNQSTIPPLIQSNGVQLLEDSDETIIQIALPNTNTQAIRAALGNVETLTWKCELIGRDANGNDVFCVDFPLLMRNRVYIGDAIEAPETSEETEELLASIRAMIADELAENFEASVSQTDSGAIISIRSPIGTTTAELSNGTDGTDGTNGTDGANGTNGTNGTNSFTYVAYASDAYGMDFSTTPSSDLKYMAMIVSPTAIPAPSYTDFADATWVKYIGDKGDTGAPMLIAYNSVTNADSYDWHSNIIEGDKYYRVSSDGGITWSAAMDLYPNAILTLTRYSNSLTAPESITWNEIGHAAGAEYSSVPAGSCFFRLHFTGLPWTEPILIENISDNATPEQIAAHKSLISSSTIRVQFGRKTTGVTEISYHPQPQAGDNYLRFFNTTGTIRYTWDFSGYGNNPSIEAIQCASDANVWHDTPGADDRWMKISVDSGENWSYFSIFPVGFLLPGNDNKTYGMKNGQWVEISGGTGGGGGGGGDTPPGDDATVYYGYINDGATCFMQNLLASQVTGGQHMASMQVSDIENPLTLSGIPAGSLVVVAVPSGYRARKDDGFGGLAAFSANNGATDTGSNGGTTIGINGATYKTYGEFVLNARTMKIHIEQE